MTNRRCENCLWWDSSTQPHWADRDTHGVCRVNPPVADDRNGGARWPFTEDCDWCGGFVLEPDKDPDFSEVEPLSKVSEQ
jgi:hypothetical protein